MTDEEIIADALARHPDCSYGDIQNGMNWMFQMTRVVNYYRNEECYLAGDIPRWSEEGYPA